MPLTAAPRAVGLQAAESAAAAVRPGCGELPRGTGHHVRPARRCLHGKQLFITLDDLESQAMSSLSLGVSFESSLLEEVTF